MRMPFRFGVTTTTGGLQLVVQVRIELSDGRAATGWSAEALSAKWFDKNPALTDAQNHHQLRRSVELAAEAYLALPAGSAFSFFTRSYRDQMSAAEAEGLNPLIASFGPAMLDRAVLDALCRALGVSFPAAMKANLAGMAVTELTPELAGFDLSGFLAAQVPQQSLALRHTVGLADPLTAADQHSPIGDGLPETLQEVVRHYRGSHYKLKISGDIPADLARLRAITAVLAPVGTGLRVTLDGNEQFRDAAALTEFWTAFERESALAPLRQALICLEQPIHRDRAFEVPVSGITGDLPVIIDESDGSLEATPRARALGYRGVSTKVCKGFYKSILNAARLSLWEKPGLLSAEDLTCEPGTALQQDLALVGFLGLGHVEKNAHHFIDGFGPRAEDAAFLAAHPELYHREGERVRLRVTAGQLDTSGVLAAHGFGAAQAPRAEGLSPAPRALWPQA
ncbi:mandelate racemase [Falsigemmobacter faecalis]|uniref:Mandelate racemase n=2 Tax=Falsigemmobacter faecalis TaxID=2488730 RepID=A0A3P3DEX5_9RHOB|nr:mandelate racemase [Falsigemmobacter faecalis]